MVSGVVGQCNRRDALLAPIPPPAAGAPMPSQWSGIEDMAARFALDGTFPLHVPSLLVPPADVVRGNASVAKLHKRIARINERLTAIDAHVQDLRAHLRPLSHDDRASLLARLVLGEVTGGHESEAALMDVQGALDDIVSSLAYVPPLSVIVPPEVAPQLLGPHTWSLAHVDGGASHAEVSGEMRAGPAARVAALLRVPTHTGHLLPRRWRARGSLPLHCTACISTRRCRAHCRSSSTAAPRCPRRWGNCAALSSDCGVYRLRQPRPVWHRRERIRWADQGSWPWAAGQR